MNNSLIVALDFSNMEEVNRFLDQFSDEQLYVKVGMELFYQNGPAIINDLKERGHKVFLDLKLHDIPHTVRQAMKGLAKLDIDLVNVHAAGGRKMMEEALAGLEEGTKPGKKRPFLIAVTQLTSTSEEAMRREQRIDSTLEESVLHYAALAKEAGLDGVVCSPWEVKKIHEKLGEEFLTITPGIRLADDDSNDQIRIATPDAAKKWGTNAIVVGRSITKAACVSTAYKMVKSSWEGK
ncbi:orotidine-5'-phosphate decarboxylase [Bacillus testis]|uniref:orotidine-5'-phosphate decarboxylase n=1 Tax=Bacillus testis TaxID=1622072 RepID=UPI00067ED81E|nr:orotidine-5'-phosphate decarboxylase [Bacillus testis]